MSLSVKLDPLAERQVEARANYLATKYGAAAAVSWFDAMDATIDRLAESAAGRPLCLDKAAEGTGLREIYFGSGRKPTHRMVFEVAGNTVTVLLVWATALDDFTADDL